jgi:hypothetical protein
MIGERRIVMQLDGFHEQSVHDQAVAAGFASVQLYLQSLVEGDAERLAIQEGLDAIAAGEVSSFEDFDREFRQRNGIPADR